MNDVILLLIALGGLCVTTQSIINAWRIKKLERRISEGKAK